jgi:hypothetical protein
MSCFVLYLSILLWKFLTEIYEISVVFCHTHNIIPFLDISESFASSMFQPNGPSSSSSQHTELLKKEVYVT